MADKKAAASNVQHALNAKRGKSAGAIMAGTTKTCNGGTAYKPKGMGRSGGDLVGGGGKKGGSY